MELRRPRLPPGAAAVISVLVTVLVVVAVLTVPHALKTRNTDTGPDRPASPSPRPTVDAPGTRTWQAVTCPRKPRSCAAPKVLDHAGISFYRVKSYTLRMSATDTAHRQLSVVLPIRDERWVLVGVEGGGAGSTLAVGLGPRATYTLPYASHEPLSLFPVSVDGPAPITVTERGTPRDGAVLHIAEYTGP